MKKSCEQIAEMLVDYADGQLSASEARKVAGHLAKCETCRKTVKALQRSLDLVGVIWEDGLAETEGIRISASGRTRHIRWPHYVAIAASVLIVMSISVTWRSMTKPAKPQPTLAEIERRISESASAARLLAAAELLAEYPDAKQIVNRQYRHIINMYPETAAAAEARLRMQ